VSESRVTRATSVPILVFLGLSVLELGQMYVTDRRQTLDRCQTKASLNASAIWGRGIIIKEMNKIQCNESRLLSANKFIKLCGRSPQYTPAPCKLTFDLENGVRVMCDVAYLCANFSL